MIEIMEYRHHLKKDVNRLMHDILVEEYGFKEFSKGILESHNKEYTQEPNKLWVALENGVVIATLGILEIDNKNCLLKRVYLESKYRGQGISQEMFNICLQYARKQKYQYIHLETYEKLERAISFYRKNGFEQWTQNKSIGKKEVHYRLDLTKSRC